MSYEPLAYFGLKKVPDNIFDLDTVGYQITTVAIQHIPVVNIWREWGDGLHGHHQPWGNRQWFYLLIHASENDALIEDWISDSYQAYLELWVIAWVVQSGAQGSWYYPGAKNPNIITT